MTLLGIVIQELNKEARDMRNLKRNEYFNANLRNKRQGQEGDRLRKRSDEFRRDGRTGGRG